MSVSSRFSRKLSRLKMSRLAFGAARLGERRMLTPETPSTTVEDIPSIPALQHALAQGITNVIDTSTVYGKQGASEIEIGKVMQGMDRNKVVLISKCGYQLHDDSDDTEAHTAETDVLLSSTLDDSGGVVATKFDGYIADQQRTQAQFMTQGRLMQEEVEHELKRAKGKGGYDNPKAGKRGQQADH